MLVSRGEDQCWRTVSGKDSGLGAGSLAHHDGSVRVVLLHGRVGAVQKGPVRHSSVSQLPPGSSVDTPKPLGTGTVG